MSAALRYEPEPAKGSIRDSGCRSFKIFNATSVPLGDGCIHFSLDKNPQGIIYSITLEKILFLFFTFP